MGIQIATILFLSSHLLLVESKYIYQGFIPDCTRQNTTLYCTKLFPGVIPRGVTELVVHDFVGGLIHSDMFSGKTWTNIASLTITARISTVVKGQAFQPLKRLTNLGLHGERFEIEDDTFQGIGTLRNLDLAYCLRVSYTSLVHSLNGMDKVSQISILNISQVSLYKESLRLDTVFSEILGSKRISMLNVSGTTVSMLNLTSIADNLCDTLEFIDFSYSHLPEIRHFKGTCPSLRRIDLDGTVLAQLFPKFIPANVYYPFDLESATTFNLFTNVNTININGLFQHGLPEIHNITIVAKNHVTVDIKEFSMSNNGITYFDLKLINASNTIEYLDMSSNGLSYLQPLLLSDNSTLRYIDLSRNELHRMAERNFTEFGTLLKNFVKLETVNMADNKLFRLPQNMFELNTLITTIDLSDNYFEQIDVDFTNNTNLLYLNLQGNRIVILSAASMEILQLAIDTRVAFTVDLRKNDLLCNQCNCKSFIRWVVENSDSIVTDSECIGEHDHKNIIDTSTVSKIEGICQRTFRIVMATTITVVGTVVLFSSVVIMVIYKRRKSKKWKLNCMLKQIRHGQYRFDFPVFLASSGEDEAFVERLVMEPLAENLRDTIGTNRDLICTGDRHFQPGHSIAEQTEIYCRKSGVVILVVSKSFCASTHCNYEANIAFTMQKPLILMFKEHVPPEDMPPVLRIIFRLYTRITWKRQGGDYVMSSTWQNVCESIFDLLIDQPKLNEHDRLEVEDEHGQ